LLSRDTLLSPTKGEGPLVVASRPTIISRRRYAKFSLGPEQVLNYFNHHSRTLNKDPSCQPLITIHHRQTSSTPKTSFFRLTKCIITKENVLTPRIFCVASLRSGKHLRRSIFGGSHFCPILRYLEIQRRTSVGVLTLILSGV
jgi:hypothetical protein